MANPWESDPVAEPWKQDIPIYTKPTPGQRATAFSRGSAEGVAGLLGLPVDTVTNAMNLAIAGYGTAVTAAGRPDLAPDPIERPYGGSERLRERFKQIGIETDNPNVWDTWSRALHMMGIVGGSSAMPSQAVRGGFVKAFQPIETTASAAATGAVAGQTEDPTLLAAAGLTGGMSPYAASRGMQAGMAMTRPGRQARETVGVFRSAGISPTVGQATDVPLVLALEDILSKLPGGHKPFIDLSRRSQEALGRRFPPGSAEAAGRGIEKGVDRFKTRTRNVWRRMDNELQDELGAKITRIRPSNTLSTLDELAGEIAELEGAARGITPDKLAQFRAGLLADMKGNPYKPIPSLRALRSRVGEQLESSSSEITRGQLKQIYAALSDDLYEAALKADGGTPGPAVATWTRQNNYWAARQERIDTALDRILGDGRGRMPEEIFAAAVPKNREQVNLLRQVLRSLPEDERDVVSRAVIGRMGWAPPAQQGELGDVFSTKTFLKNWNNLADGAKAQLIPNAVTRGNLNKVARIAGTFKETQETAAAFAGRFGSLGQVVWLALVGGAGFGTEGGVLARGSSMVGTGVALTGGSRGLANLLTDEDFVGWLAGASKPVDPQRHMQRLAVIYNNAENEQTQIDIEDFVDSLNDAMDSISQQGESIEQQTPELLQGP